MQYFPFKKKISLLLSAHKLLDWEKKEKEKTSQRSRPSEEAARCGHWRDYLLLAPQRWVTWYFPPHLVVVVSPWRDDLYCLGWKIKEGFLTLIPWSLHLKSPENQPWLRNCLAALQNASVKLNSGKTASLLLLSLQYSWSCSLGGTELLMLRIVITVFSWDNAHSANCCLTPSS